jgi:hypothetical protein
VDEHAIRVNENLAFLVSERFQLFVVWIKKELIFKGRGAVEMKKEDFEEVLIRTKFQLI